MHLTRDILHNQHRLSHQQIDDWLDEKQGGDYMVEKLELMEQVREFLIISDALQKAECKFVLIKGPLLSYRIYGDAAYRRSKDLDILVQFSEVGNTVILLQKLGFKPVFHQWPTEEPDIQFKEQRVNQYHLYHAEKNIGIELHWKLLTHPPIPQKTFDKLVNSHLTEVEFTKRKFSVLDAEMELVYLVIHGGFHAWRRLKWLVDIHEIVVRELYDKKAFSELVVQLKAQRLVSLCNEMLKVFYPGQAKLPAFKPAPRFMVKHSLSMINTDTDEEFDSFSGIIRYFYFVLLAFPGITHKVNTFKLVFNSLRDAGDHKITFPSLIKSLLFPAQFLKKRYRFEK